jgi:hypothetical protein
MKRLGPGTFPLLVLATSFLLIASSTPALGQSFEIGAFGGYSRMDVPNFPENTASVGARMDLPFVSFVKFEIEGAYDFRIPQVTFTTVGILPAVTVNQVGGPRINGGLKFQTHGGSYFFFLKGGADFLQPEAVVRGANGALLSTTSGNTIVKGTFYPGAGISFFAGFFGLRVDAGDEIFWLNGDARNNWRINFGPSFRF